MSKRLLFLYNTSAGRGAIRQALADVLNIFAEGGYDVLAHPSLSPEDTTQTLTRLLDSMDVVVAAGGDGTLDRVVDAVMNIRPDIPVGYLPAGSTNDFAASLGIPKNLTEAAQAIVDGHIYACDVGAFNDAHFVYVAAFGMFTSVSYETDQTLKNNLGHLAYLLEAGKQVFNVPSYHLQLDIDGQKVEGNYTYGMVTNSRYVGGMKNITGPAVDMNDGFFEVTLVHTPTNPIETSQIVQNLLNNGEPSEMVEKYKASRVVIDFNEEVPWTLDGEFGGAHRQVVIQNRYQALQLFLAEA